VHVRLTVGVDGWTAALMHSLREAPLLVGDLPEAAVMNRSLLGLPEPHVSLNFEQKLGHLYEDALLHLLRRSEACQLRASHLQVINADGITLGEMDYLIRDCAEQYDFQLEIAVKFYLAYQINGSWSYPGPDPRDNWQRKLTRMRTHQLTLGQRPETRKLLSDRFGVDGLQVRQLIYGRLFVPMEVADCPMPQSMVPDGLRGRWLYCREWSRWMRPDVELRVIPKALWPVLLTDSLLQSLPLVNEAELIRLASDRCVLFAVGDYLMPTFLVPDGWPKTE